MDIFPEKHRESLLGVLEGFDRIIFKGHLTSMFPRWRLDPVWRALTRSVAAHLVRQPKGFFLPPRKCEAG